MSYKNALQVLPGDLLEKIQEYVDGEWLYIPRVSDNRKEWGAKTSTRRELRDRNNRIYLDFLAGESINSLAEKYYLSVKSIQRIVGELKKTT